MTSPSAVAIEDLHPALCQNLRRRKHICSVGVATQRDDRSVFEQKKYVADSALFALLDELLLQAEAGSVVDGAELDEGDHWASAYIESSFFFVASSSGWRLGEFQLGACPTATINGNSYCVQNTGRLPK